MTLRYFDYYRKGKATIAPAMRAIHRGLAVQGLSRSKNYVVGSRFDFALCWGWRQEARLREFWKGPVLYAEVGYLSEHSGKFDDGFEYAEVRTSHVSFCWNGVHGLGDDYLSACLPGDRFESLGVAIQPWKTRPQGEVVILGQTALDLMAIPPGEPKAWNKLLIPYAETQWPGKVRFRAHPRYYEFQGPSLLDDLYNCRRAITYSSTAAVETILAGIPTQIMSPRSIAYPMGCPYFTDDEVTPDRENWANRLAWLQWTNSEIESGEFWEIVRRGL